MKKNTDDNRVKVSTWNVSKIVEGINQAHQDGIPITELMFYYNHNDGSTGIVSKDYIKNMEKKKGNVSDD